MCLSLPRAFSNCFIQENNTRATLLSPLGKSWHVRVCRDSNMLNFEEGWEKFAEDHKLAMGDFLVFKHIGSLMFDVTIFDPTTCERQYHSTVGLTSGVTNDQIPEQEEAPKEEELSNSFEEVSMGFRRQQSGKRAAEPMESVTSIKRGSIDVEELTEQRHAPKEPDVMKEAPRGPQFETLIRRFHKKPYVEIPRAFAASNKLSSVSRVFLKDPKGVVWPTSVKHQREGFRIRSRFSQGWRRFCAANNLEDGDICVFELRERNLLHVQVRKKMIRLQAYRRRKIRPMKTPEDVSMSNKKPLYKQNAAKIADTVQDHMPLPYLGFTSKITPSEAGRGYLSLPRAFTKCFIQENNTRATLLSPLGKSWHVKVCGDGNTLNFEEGWEKFAEDHKLAMGDFLVFMHLGSLVFDVTIFDSTTCERQYHSTVGLTSTRATDDKVPVQEEAPKEEELSNTSEEASKGFGRQQASSCGKRASEPLESAVTSMKRRSIDLEEFKEQRHDPKEPDVIFKEAPRRPQFKTVIRRFQKRPSVEIPAAFAASNKLSSVSRLLLMDPKGVEWRTNVRHSRNRYGIRSRFSQGWRRFCAVNNLEEGDICVFELRERNVLHVQVRKKAIRHQTYGRRKIRPMKVPEDVSMSNKKPLYKQNAAKVADTVQDHMPLPYLGFTSKITPSEAGRGYLRIPRKFLLSFAEFSTARQVILVDGQSWKWPVNIWHWTEKALEHACLGAGWRAFCSCNNVVAGDKCFFRLMSSNGGFVFHVEVVKALSRSLSSR